MVKNIHRAVLDRLRGRDADESGSLILDILIGMAIFALIAIIAVSAISQYRLRAYEQSAVSDVTALAQAFEVNFTEEGLYPSSAWGAERWYPDMKVRLITEIPPRVGWPVYGPTIVSDVTLSTGNMTQDNYNTTDGEGFITCVQHETIPGSSNGNAWAVYDSTGGGLVGSGTGAGCYDEDGGLPLYREFDDRN